METFRVQRINEDAKIPIRATTLAAGFDVCAARGGSIEPSKRVLVPTGLRVEIPEGYYLRIAPRSGLSWKNGIMVGAGVVDADYKDEVMVLLMNLGDSTFTYNAGDRVAQFILEKIYTGPVVEVEAISRDGDRGGGFGSTGTA